MSHLFTFILFLHSGTYSLPPCSLIQISFLFYLFAFVLFETGAHWTPDWPLVHRDPLASGSPVAPPCQAALFQGLPEGSWTLCNNALSVLESPPNWDSLKQRAQLPGCHLLTDSMAVPLPGLSFGWDPGNLFTVGLTCFPWSSPPLLAPRIGCVLMHNISGLRKTWEQCPISCKEHILWSTAASGNLDRL